MLTLLDRVNYRSHVPIKGMYPKRKVDVISISCATACLSFFRRRAFASSFLRFIVLRRTVSGIRMLVMMIPIAGARINVGYVIL